MKLAIVLFALLATAAFGQSGPIPTDADFQKAAQIRTLEVELKRLEMNRTFLLEKYTADHKHVKAIEAEIARVNQRIADLGPMPASKRPPVDPETDQLISELRALREVVQSCGSAPSLPACQGGELKQRLALTYGRAAANNEAILLLFADAIEKFDSSRANTKSAMQVSQIADEQNVDLIRLLVLQNQRIIQLLEQILKKK